MNDYFYLDNNNQQQGPISPTQFSMYGVNANTLVWCKGMTDWQRAGSVDELSFYFGSNTGDTTTPPPYTPNTPPQQPNYGSNYGGETPNYGSAQGNSSNGTTDLRPCPDSNLVWAILSTIFCCIPTGVVAIIYASKVSDRYLMGDIKGAYDASKKAKNWALYGLLASVVVGIIYFVCFLAIGGLGMASTL